MKVTRPRIEMPEMVPDLRPLRGSDTHTGPCMKQTASGKPLCNSELSLLLC